MGGFGSAVLEFLSDEGIINLPTKCLGLPDWFIEQGPQDLLREKYGITADGIYQQSKQLLDKVSTQPVLTSLSLRGVPHAHHTASDQVHPNRFSQNWWWGTHLGSIHDDPSPPRCESDGGADPPARTSWLRIGSGGRP